MSFLGRLNEPFTSAHIRRNRFCIVVRSLEPADIERAVAALEEVRVYGIPNYFDEQRFGAASADGFVGKAMALGDFEGALRLALLAPYKFDRARHKREKAILEAHWGNWSECQAHLPAGSAREVAGHLVHRPGDFRGTAVRLLSGLQGLHLSAYQSFLWNRMLARWLQCRLQPGESVSVAMSLGQMPMHRRLAAQARQELATLKLPLPTARGQADPNDPNVQLMQSVLAEEGLTREQLKVQGVRELFFSRGERAGLCLPLELRYEAAEDDRNSPHKKLTLSFDLERGSYATLVVKRAFA